MAMNDGAMQPRDDGYTAHAPVPERDIKAARYAVIAWVNRGDDITPVQATGGYLE